MRRARLEAGRAAGSTPSEHSGYPLLMRRARLSRDWRTSRARRSIVRLRFSVRGMGCRQCALRRGPQEQPVADPLGAPKIKATPCQALLASSPSLALEPCGRGRAQDRGLRKGTGTVRARRAARGEPGPGADVGRGAPSPGADVGVAESSGTSGRLHRCPQCLSAPFGEARRRDFALHALRVCGWSSVG